MPNEPKPFSQNLDQHLGLLIQDRLRFIYSVLLDSNFLGS
jgi:hypothetical protein